ncbi:hypothetical protein Tco_0644519, partial [Tanacetum coccineum]
LLPSDYRPRNRHLLNIAIEGSDDEELRSSGRFHLLWCTLMSFVSLKDDEKEHEEDEDMQKQIEEMTEQTDARHFQNMTGLKADEAGWSSNKLDHTESCSGLEAYSWGQKVVSVIEAAWGAKKTKNETN